MASLRAFVIGCGSMGSRRAAILREWGHEVDTLDPDYERAARAGNSVDRPRSPPYDAVFVCSPPETHVMYVREAVRQGIGRAILVEKPLAADLGLTETLIDEAERAGVVTMMGQTLRWHKDLRELQSWIQGGALGSLLHVDARFGHRLDLWDHPDPVGTYTHGALIDAATHELDLALWIANSDVEWVIGDAWRSGLHEMAEEDIADIILGLQSGGRATVHVDLADVTYRRSLKVIGGTNTAEWQWREDPGMYHRETAAFLAAAAGGERPADWPSLRQGRRVLSLAIAARQSKGRKLAV